MLNLSLPRNLLVTNSNITYRVQENPSFGRTGDPTGLTSALIQIQLSTFSPSVCRLNMGIKAKQLPASDTPPSKEIGPGRDDDQLDRAIHRKALLKLDLILLTTVTVIYFLNFLDRCVRYGRVSGL